MLKIIFKNILFGISIGLLYSFSTNKLFNIYSVFIWKRALFFCFLGLVFGFLYFFIFHLFNFLIKKDTKLIMVTKYCLTGLFAALGCSVIFFIINFFVLIKYSSSPCLFMKSVHRLSFEILIYFSLFSALITSIFGLIKVFFKDTLRR